MTDHDDDERGADDDPMLKSMRAVWLQMRDEDPPESGVAALLVAAREKAGAMQPKDPWWQRALAVLRRPPVLAFASVVVLVGGALVITNRRDSMETPSSVVTSAPTHEPDNYSHGGDGKIGGVKDRERETFGDAGVVAEAAQTPQQQAQPPANDTDVVTSRTHVPPPPPPPPPPRRQRPPESPPVDSSQTVTTGDLANGQEKLELNGRVEGGLVPEVPPPTKEPLVIAQDDGKADKDAAAVKKASGKGTEGVDEQTRADPAPPRGQTTRRVDPPVDQLVQQCESAAARGDCAAVRTMAARIKKIDPGAYRDRVERSSKIAHCLK